MSREMGELAWGILKIGIAVASLVGAVLHAAQGDWWMALALYGASQGIAANIEKERT